MREKKKIIIEAELLESSLSRLWRLMQDRDTGIITANRSEYDKAENKERNDALLIDLQRLYDVTSVRGRYIERYGEPGAIEVGENSFFVAEPDDTRYIKKYSISLKKALSHLGGKYEQDSVLYVPKGGFEGILIGTKEGVWPGLGVEVKLSNPVFGRSGQMITQVRGRPFIFLNEKISGYHKNDGPGNWFTEFGRFLRTSKYNKK